jgi:hypothetical protein
MPPTHRRPTVTCHTNLNTPGILRTLLFYPLDFCRTRLTADTTPAGQARPYRGIASCLRHAAVTEGLGSWYKGLGLSLPGVVVYTSISFTAYDGLKVWLCRLYAWLSEKKSQPRVWCVVAECAAQHRH